MSLDKIAKLTCEFEETCQKVEPRLRQCSYRCRLCDGEVVYYDDGDWRYFTCMSCKSLAPLSSAALILATKGKPSKIAGKFYQQQRAEKRIIDEVRKTREQRTRS